MLKWLASLGGSNNNPMSAARTHLESLTGTPAAVVQQVCDWVEDYIRTDSISLDLLKLGEERLAPVLAEVATMHIAQRRNTTLPRLLRSYSECFARAYAHLLKHLPPDSGECSTAAVHAAYLYCQANRAARKALDDPTALRTEMTGFLAKTHQLGIVLNKVSLFPSAPQTTVLQEFALSSLWEASPFDALTLEQVEYLDRAMSFYGNRIVMKSTPGVTAPFAVLPDGRVIASGQGDMTKAVLYVGAGPLNAILAGLAKLQDSDPLPEWAGKLLPHTSMQTLKNLAQRMCVTWERKQIKRGSERIKRDDDVRVAGGFDNIRRAVAYSAYVRSGGKLRAYGSRGPIVTERLREVLVGIDESHHGHSHSPIEVLEAMEAAGDKSTIETWRASDSSAVGYSLVQGGFRSWLVIGSLIAVREMDHVDWRIGVIRRLYSAAGKRQVGVELMPGKGYPGGVINGTDPSKVNLSDLRDAIVLRTEECMMVITPFTLIVDDVYIINSQDGKHAYKVLSRVVDTTEYSISIVVPNAP